MKTVDARKWDIKTKHALDDAAASGGAVFELDDNRRIVVIDLDLWSHLQRQLPSLPEILRRIHRESSED